MMRRLIDIYREDVANLPAMEARYYRKLWHSSAKRYLALQSITSDIISDPEPDADGYTTVAIDAVGGRFFLAHPIDQLVELYRATKPKVRPTSS